MKPSKSKQIRKSGVSAKNTSSKKTDSGPSFLQFIFSDKTNRQFLIAGVAISVVYAIALIVLFPRPSFYIDSGTYIQSAQLNVGVSFRPIGYSDFIRFFHNISVSSTVLVLSQFACNVLANLFMFFTFQYFFPLSKWYRIALFILLICNPLYLFYSNYILSEAFFCSFTIAWITVLLWVIQRPNWINFFAQLILLALLFKLRYNALFFPLFSTAAFILSGQARWKKIAGIAISFFVIAAIVQNITAKTERVTDTRVFSAFGGWQIASNALNVIKHTDIDSNSLSSEESKEIYSLSRKFFDSLDKANPQTAQLKAGITGYIWDPHAPLKEYLPYFSKKRYIKFYFKAWTALGPVFFNFGKEIIINNPVKFLQYFVWPNAKQYWYPPLEAYADYNINKDSVDKVVKNYYHYPTNKVDLSHTAIHNAVMRPWRYLFPLVNLLFLLLVAVYFIMRLYKKAGLFFNTALFFGVAFYIANFSFSIVVSPTVFRYQVEIITLCVIFSVYLMQIIFLNGKNGPVPVISAGDK